MFITRKDIKNFSKSELSYYIDKLKNIYSRGEINFSGNKLTIVMSNENYNFYYEISDDYTKIKINEKIYDIPQWYNKEMIKINDLKTMQMIFYSLLSDEIQKLEELPNRHN